MTIEDLIQQAAARGLTHLTLYPVPSVDAKTTYWHARATPSTGHHYVEETDTDPVLALQRALAALPKAAKRKVTAAVKGKTPEPTRDDNERDQQDPAADWLLRP